MILHIADDEKFIDSVIEIFETVAPGNNIYLINHPSVDSLHYIKYRGLGLYVFNYNSTKYKEVINRPFNAVIFHGLWGYKYELVNQFSDNIHLHWISWGFDLYFIPPLLRNLLLPETRRIHFNELKRKDKIIQKLAMDYARLWNVLNMFRYGELSDYYKLKKALKRIHSISTVVENEYLLVQRYLTKKISYLPFRYGSIEQFGKGIYNEICTEDCILIGNSATYSGNHLDAFQVLCQTKISNPVYVPLSYGDKHYGQLIAEQGKQLFGEKFHPLFDFIPLDEYNQILKKCGIVVMNYVRQQAMANIIVALWLGARIYLRPENPVYQFLCQNDFKIFDINHFEIECSETHENLALWNRERLAKFYRHDVILDLTANLVQNLNRS